jgi:hypothetical protein
VPSRTKRSTAHHGPDVGERAASIIGAAWPRAPPSPRGGRPGAEAAGRRLPRSHLRVHATLLRGLGVRSVVRERGALGSSESSWPSRGHNPSSAARARSASARRFRTASPSSARSTAAGIPKTSRRGRRIETPTTRARADRSVERGSYATSADSSTTAHLGRFVRSSPSVRTGASMRLRRGATEAPGCADRSIPGGHSPARRRSPDRMVGLARRVSVAVSLPGFDGHPG